MKRIFASRREHHLIKVCVFLVTVALIAGMAGCGPTQYDLTISSTKGGEVTTPGEGTFTYDEGTVVNLVAEAEEGYYFVNWTSYVHNTIADVNAAATNITINGHNHIKAKFGLEIRDWYDLDAIRDNLDDHHILMNDLDSTTAGYEELASPTANGGKGWQPIGTETDPFMGALDGQGHEIRDLYIGRLDEGGVGLFGYVGEEGVIKDIGAVNVTVTGSSGHVGGLVGCNEGRVSDSYSTGNVTGYFDVGGLVGWNDYGSVSNSYSSCNVTGGLVAIGGLVGHNYYGTLSTCYSTGSVTGNSSVGGLVGQNDGWVDTVEGTVSNSYSTSSVTGYFNVGGLLGSNNGGTVSESYSTGSVTGDCYVGGLVGVIDGTVTNSYSTGNVTGNFFVGGLVGANGGTVSNSFWDIETSGQATSAGGTGKTTAQMQDIDTFSSAGWNITAVANPGTRNPSYIWNIATTPPTYPFLSWQP